MAAAPENSYYGPATISWTGSTVIIAAVAVSGYAPTATTALDYWYQYAGTGTWHHQQVATGVVYDSYAGPSIGWTGSTVIITDTDSSGNLDYWYQYAGTGPWHQQQVAPASAAGSGQFRLVQPGDQLDGQHGHHRHDRPRWRPVLLVPVRRHRDLASAAGSGGLCTWHPTTRRRSPGRADRWSWPG